MNPLLTPKDWENLSTYLDGQLTGTEKRLLMDQLALRPELAQSLEELRRTRAVLRAAPRRRAPRNFTLTPAMVRQTRRRFTWGWAPSLGFASALATILLVLSFFFRFSPAGLPAAALQAPVAARQSASASEAYPPVIVWNGNSNSSTPLGMGAGSGAVPGASVLPQPTLAPDFAVPAPALAPSEAAITSENAPSATPAPTAAAKALIPQAAIQSTAAQDRSGSGVGPILGVAPTEERGKLVVPTQEQVRAYATSVQPSDSSWAWFQLALGGAALVSGLLAFLLWRRSRH